MYVCINNFFHFHSGTTQRMLNVDGLYFQTGKWIGCVYIFYFKYEVLLYIYIYINTHHHIFYSYIYSIVLQYMQVNNAHHATCILKLLNKGHTMKL